MKNRNATTKELLNSGELYALHLQARRARSQEIAHLLSIGVDRLACAVRTYLANQPALPPKGARHA